MHLLKWEITTVSGGGDKQQRTEFTVDAENIHTALSKGQLVLDNDPDADGCMIDSVSLIP